MVIPIGVPLNYSELFLYGVLTVTFQRVVELGDTSIQLDFILN